MCPNQFIFRFRELKIEKSASTVMVQDKCAICLDSLTSCDTLLLIKTCGHFYHQSCLKCWLHHSSSCPSCRHPVTLSRIELAIAVPANPTCWHDWAEVHISPGVNVFLFYDKKWNVFGFGEISTSAKHDHTLPIVITEYIHVWYFACIPYLMSK